MQTPRSEELQGEKGRSWGWDERVGHGPKAPEGRQEKERDEKQPCPLHPTPDSFCCSSQPKAGLDWRTETLPCSQVDFDDCFETDPEPVS